MHSALLGGEASTGQYWFIGKYWVVLASKGDQMVLWYKIPKRRQASKVERGGGKRKEVARDEWELKGIIEL